LSWSSRREIAEVWAVGAELADAALGMVRRRRRRAGRHSARPPVGRHTLTYDTLGSLIPVDVAAQAAAELADTLRRIDESDH
jgi:hypothetical protein